MNAMGKIAAPEPEKALSGQSPMDHHESEYMVTVDIAGQTFGIPVRFVQDVLGPQRMTRVPLAPKRVAGVMNLRGRIVTAISSRTCLGLLPHDGVSMFIVVPHGDELYGIMVDKVGEAVMVQTQAIQPNPPHMDPRWRDLSPGVVRQNDRLIILLDLMRLIEAPDGDSRNGDQRP